ncbi:MAG: chromosome segregation protein SMC [Thermoplasmata archaeon]
MRIKEIHMKDFKSFHDEAIIKLEPGFTGVTGPNGSGKSNILDAIIFVLGQKGSKSMRVQKLSELIFNGGSNKKPASSCSVTIIFDNKSREIPINNDNIEITRVVKLIGNNDDYSSNFYINGKKVSQHEIESILHKIRINVDTYNIVQQGDITDIIKLPPKERRKIIDAISGISIYDEEIEKSEIKKAEINQNMVQLQYKYNDLLERQTVLKYDKEQAEKFFILKKKYEEEKAAKKWKTYYILQNTLKSYQEQCNSLEQIISNANVNKKELENKLSSKNDEKNLLSKELKEKMDYKNNIILQEKQKYTEMRAKLEEKLENIKNQLQKHTEMLSENKKEIEVRIKNKNDLVKEIEKIKISIQKSTEELSKNNSEFENIKKKIKESSDEYNELEKKKIALQKDAERNNEQIKMINDQKMEISKKIEEYVIEKNSVANSIKEIDFKIEQSSKNEDIELDNLIKKNKELSNAFYNQHAYVSTLSNELKKIENEIYTLEREKGKLEGRKETQSNTVIEAIYDLKKSGEDGIIGALKDLISVDEKYQKAVFVAMGSRMNSIIVTNENVAAKSIEYLKEHRIGRATFIPLNKINVKPKEVLDTLKKEFVLGYCRDLIKISPQYKVALDYAIGDTIVVDTIENAKSIMGGKRIVTLEGDLIEANNAMIGGHLQKEQYQFSSKNNELFEITGKISKLSEEKDNISYEYDMAEKTLKKIQEDLNRIGVEIEKAKAKKSNNANNISLLNEQKESFVKRYKEIEEEIKDLNDKTSEINKRLMDLNTSNEKIKVELEKIEKQMSKLNANEIGKPYTELEKSIEILRNNIEQLKQELSKKGAELSSTEERVNDLEIKSREIIEENEVAKKGMLDYTEELRITNDKINSADQVLSKLDESYQQISRKMEGIDQEIKELTAKIKYYDNELTSKKLVLDTMQRKVEETETEINKAQLELDVVANESLTNMSMSALDQLISEHEKELNNFGNVNMKAIEEYAEIESTVKSLKESMSKMEEEIKGIEKVVEEVNKHKKERFMETFNQINKNFIELYSQLSMGGSAELMLENSDDVFEGGLIIKAKPVGKKVLRLEALSGGEKSLVALTFIMAIQKFEPSPFYVLDEVDMFLDAVAAERVAKMISSISKNIQIIMISLRKASLKETDKIYGITHNGKGESIVLTKDLSNLKLMGKESNMAVEGGEA